MDLKTPSPLRQKAPCPYYEMCGGCQLLHLSPQGQAAFKQEKVNLALGRFKEALPIVMAGEPYHYRNKSVATFQKDRRGKFKSGIYEENTHRVVEVEDCLIQDTKANAIIKTIGSLLAGFKLEPYDEDRKKGFLRHVLVRTGYHTGEIMVVLVTGTLIFPSKNNFVKELRRIHPEITTILQNVNDHDTSMVLGKREIVLFGSGAIEDTLLGRRFKISAGSFYQVNPAQTELLYKIALEMAAIESRDIVLDAYCGTGTIGILAARDAEAVIGVETSASAVKDAISNAKANQVKNIWFHQADASELMAAMARDNQRIDVVFLDPPRTGSTVKFLEALIKLSPKRVVYISCEPQTQARDITYLDKKGYKVQKIQPVDMFPGTYHVEAIILMTRSGSGDKK
ncbi:MAG: RNA methyltransferase [delta proteobacterium ML8_F1]|nr:MAG: RNA methyltransferase [delta proteobacterium ML8_F1]